LTNLFTDYETQSLADLEEVGTSNYVEDPSTLPILFSWAVDKGKPKVWECQWDPMPAELRDALTDVHVTKLAWRVPFERGITHQCLKIHTEIESWFDVMVLARYLSFPGKLEKACEAMGLPADIRKMADEGKVLIPVFCMPVSRGRETPLFGKEPPFFNTRENKPQEWKLFKEYNLQDTLVEQHIFYALCDRYMLPPDEIQLWYLDQIINERGMPVDVPFAKNALEIAKLSIAETRKTLVEMTGLENPNSDSQMMKWVQERGYSYTSMNKSLVKLELTNPDTKLTPEAQQVLHIRKEFRRSSYTKLESIVNRTSSDGRLRDCFAFMGGARTGRWAGQDVQFQNLARPNKKVEKNLELALGLIRTLDFEKAKDAFSPEYEVCGKKYKIPSALDMVISCLRSAFQAKEGNKLVVCDLSAIENRVLGWLANCPGISKVFKKGLDPYISFAALMFGIPYDQVTKEQRQIAKPAVLGLGYGLGPGVFKKVDEDTGKVTYEIIWRCTKCGKNVPQDHTCYHPLTGDETGDLVKTGLLGYAENMGVILTLEQAYLAHQTFHRVYPEVPQLWWDLEKAAVSTIQTGRKNTVYFVEFSRTKRRNGQFILRCKLPSGRYLHYINARVTVEKKVSPRTGKEYDKASIFYDGIGHGVGATTHKMGWAPVYTYGGKLCENLVQAIARDILAYGMMLAHKIGMFIVGHVHDEIICEEKIEDCGFSLNDLRACMSETPPWAPGLPLAADGFESQVYRK